MIRYSLAQNKIAICLFFVLLHFLLPQEVRAEEIELPLGSRKLSSQYQECPNCSGGKIRDFIYDTYEVNLSIGELKRFYEKKLLGTEFINQTPISEGGYQYSWLKDNQPLTLMLSPHPVNASSSVIVFIRPSDATQPDTAKPPKREPVDLNKLAKALYAKEIASEDFWVNAKKLMLKRYTTLYPYEQVKERYQQELTNKDWRLASPAGADLLVFQKENKYITIGKLLVQPGNTEFMVSEGELPYSKEGEETAQKEPVFLPRTAGLTQINYIQNASGKSLYITYRFNRDFEKAVRFYTQQMQALGWDLKENMDLRDTVDELATILPKDNKLINSFKDAGSQLLKFKAKNASCNVTIIEMGDKTSFIQVRYEKK